MSAFTSAWTGTELVVYSTTLDKNLKAVSVAAAYDPAHDAWRPLPADPYSIASVEGGDHAVWTGTEVLVFGQTDAAYNPSANRWRRLNRSLVYGPSVTVWTGRQVLMWGGGCCDTASAEGAEYDPATGVWQPMPASPLAGRHTTGVWTGEEMVVVGGQAHATTFYADAAAYNPTRRTWRTLPSLPAPRWDTTAVWTGTEVIVVGGRDGNGKALADGYAYNPATDGWRHLPRMDTTRYRYVAVWSGRQVLVWGGQSRPPTAANPTPGTPAHGAAYDPATNAWTVMPPAPLRHRIHPVAAWTGTELLIWGGDTWGANIKNSLLHDGAGFTPAFPG